MVSRRWMWGLAGAAAALWLARSVRAETEAEYFQGPYMPRVPAPAPAASAPAARSTPRAAPVPRPVAAPRAPAYPGYAAESARTATRLPPHERQARDFLRAAALHARFEVDAARLAAGRAHSPQVREFAEELLRYHEGTSAELLHLLAARGMAPPMMDSGPRRQLNRLAKLEGARFDREFMERVGREWQREHVQQFEKAVSGVSDPVLLAWIERQLPSLRQQQSAAARLRLASWDAGASESARRRPVASTSGRSGGERTPQPR